MYINIQPVVKPVWQQVWQNGCIVYTARCQTSCTTRFLTTGWTNSGCSLNTVVKPVVKPVWQPAVSCIQTFNRLSNRFDNRLYRVNGVIGSRIWAFDWYQNRWSWTTLNGVMAVILRYFTALVYDVIVKQLPRFQNPLLIVSDHIKTISVIIQRLLAKTNW